MALGIPAAGVYAVSEDRRRLVFALAFYVFAAGLIMAHVFSTEDVAADTLFGAASVYLLLGLVWTLAYTLLERIQPGSFSLSAAPTATDGAAIFDYLYYSFATLTTLGYGDITPLTAEARSLAILEAVTGVLYVAVLIARLVGMYGRAESKS